MQLFYSPDYVGAKHGFDTTRKSGWIADSLVNRPIDGVELRTPDPINLEHLSLVHDIEYVKAVQTGEPRDLAESQGFDWDPALWRMVLSSNGGVLAAARAALNDGVAGSLSSGLHHARRDHGAGFCTFNGLAIAAKTLLDERAVHSVLILDFDAHCGGGTASLIDGDSRIWQSDVSVSSYDYYSHTSNADLVDITEAQDYLPAIENTLEQAHHLGPFDACIYNAGMDPYQGCAIGGLEGITADVLAERERLVFDWCQRNSTPVAFVLAGGYVGSRLNQETLVRLHRLTIKTAAARTA